MYIRCPKCHTLYRVEAKDLRGGSGNVECGRCEVIFSALDALVEGPEPPQPHAGQRTGNAATDTDTDVPLAGLRADPRRPALAERPEGEADPAEHFREFEAGPGGRAPPWGVAVAAAVAALVYQVLIFESDRLAAQQPGLRPWLERLCPRLGCQVPEFRDPSRIAVVERDLTPAHNGADGLEFRAVLANDADQAQPYPRLKLTLSQYNGAPMAQRIFNPEDYLQAPAAGGKMAAGAAVEILLTIANPGKDVGGFSFELL